MAAVLEQDIINLANDLTQEKLFIDSEKQQLCSLNEKIARAGKSLIEICWVRGEQRRNYHDLLNPNSRPADCCFRANLLNNIEFIASHKVLGRLDGLYAALLQGLRNNPVLLAEAIYVGEKSHPELVRPLLHTFFSSLYAGCVFVQDHVHLLTLLHELLQLQVCSSSDPHRLLRQGSCAFSQLFRTYVESLPQAKVFLTAALHQPLLELLSEDELFLDMDPSKAALRFPPQVRVRRFGVENTPEYEAALEKYRSKVVFRLAKHINRFVSQMAATVHCLPATLLWLIRTLKRQLLRSHYINGSSSAHHNGYSGNFGTDLKTPQKNASIPLVVEENGGDSVHLSASSSSLHNGHLEDSTDGIRFNDINSDFRHSHSSSSQSAAVCCLDLVFMQFICPALLEPEVHGICDAPVSHVSRFNLMQVAQCIQSLVMSHCQGSVDTRLANILPHLNITLLPEIVSAILEGECCDLPPVSCPFVEGRVTGSVVPTDIVRDVCLIPQPQLLQLHYFLHTVLTLLPEEGPHRAELEGLLSKLPVPSPPPDPALPAASSVKGVDHPQSSTSSGRKSIMTKVKLPVSKNRPSRVSADSTLEQDGASVSPSVTPSHSATSLTVTSPTTHGDGQSTSPHLISCNGGSPCLLSNGGVATSVVAAGSDASYASSSVGYDKVLVLPVNSDSQGVLPGLMTEENLLSSLQQCRPNLSSDMGPSGGGGGGCGGSSSGSVVEEVGEGDRKTGDLVVEKRTRFSLSHDDGSNTSDNLEAVSEAASNHSVESSLDDVDQEDQPDNLSDMMSANVSGRGTPNVSGRETPSSQITEGDDAAAGLRGAAVDPDGRNSPPRENLVPGSLPKPARDDIEEKFGKFEIKPIAGGDETFSLVSDTWSTDVLASDSETIEAADRDVAEQRQDLHDQLLNRHLLELDRMQGRYRPAVGGLAENVGETFETASEAWSTDVLTSDSERLQEFDTDDSQSVARSDDAGRSEVDDVLMGYGDVREPRRDLLKSFNNHDMHRQIYQRVDVASRSDLAASLAVVEDVPSVIEERDNVEVNASVVVKSPPPLVLNASRSLDSGSAVHDSTTLSTMPLMQINDEFGEPTLPSSAPPTVGFRNVPSMAPSEHNDLINLTVNNGPNIVMCDQASSGDQVSPSDVLAHKMLTVLSTSSSSNQSKKVNSTSSNSLEDRRDSSLSSHKKNKLISGSSAEDSSLHLSTTSLASSTCSSCDISGRSGHRSTSHVPNPATQKATDLFHFVEGIPTISAPTGLFTDDQQLFEASSASYVTQASLMDSLDSGTGLSYTEGNRSSISSSDKVDTLIASLPVSSASDGRNLSYTGAIPKSISFDKTAEHGGDRDSGFGDFKNKKGFFKSLKLSFKGRRKGGGGSLHDGFLRSLEGDIPYEAAGRGPQETSRPEKIEEATDDILAKYRGRGDVSSTFRYNCSAVANGIESGKTSETLISEEDERLIIDVNNVEASYAFQDAKRKLRLVLSVANASFVRQCLPFPLHGVAIQRHRSDRLSEVSRDGVLSRWLQQQVAEARSLQDNELLAQLTEAHRCLQLFSVRVESRLIASLREDYELRAPYIAYLVRARQGLLTTLHGLHRISRRVEHDTDVLRRSLAAKCVQLFLERRDIQLREFTRTFNKLCVPDEKVLHVVTFLESLLSQIKSDEAWRNLNDDLLSLAEAALEQAVMSHIYDHALYPNGEADINRDQVLYEHIQKLAAVVTPNHKDLCIPKLYQYECPWPSAQLELQLLGAYKTAGDKLRCVTRAAEIVLNLLSLAHTSTVPAADDFMPVLIYVIIKANPRHLLSTIEYIRVHQEQRMEGEQRYYWTQFCSAVEFIKTMDYVT